MLVSLVFAAALAGAAPILSPEALSAVAPVHDAIAREKAAQAKLPPTENDGETLVRMARLDQAARAGMGAVDPSKIPAAERNAAFQAIVQEIGAVDRANQTALLAMLPPEGWFTIGRYGKEASKAAFVIVQHADVDLWRRFVPVLEPLAAKGEVAGGDFALMHDRLENAEGRRQLYGSQVKCRGGQWVPEPIEDPSGLDQRRARLGMEPHASYLAKLGPPPAC